jgi:hypothetical protein
LTEINNEANIGAAAIWQLHFLFKGHFCCFKQKVEFMLLQQALFLYNVLCGIQVFCAE